MTRPPKDLFGCFLNLLHICLIENFLEVLPDMCLGET